MSNDRLEELSRKLDEVVRRLEKLENALSLLIDLDVLPGLLSLLLSGTRICSSRLRALRRALVAEAVLRQLPTHDDISQCVVEALAEGGPMNISELTRAVRARRGRASRRVVRQRLERLRELGLVVEVKGFGRKFDLPGRLPASERRRLGGQRLATRDRKREER